MGEGKAKKDWFDLSTLKEPYRIEGKKTMGLELAEQLDWQLPDVILYPTGGGTGLIGMWKAFAELEALGWLKSTRKPRMISCQSEGCAPISTAFDRGERFAAKFENAATIASGVRVPVAVGDFMILDAVRASGGTALAVPEAVIEPWMRKAVSLEGLSICPETAVCLGALDILLARGDLRPDERIILFTTGAAQKYPEAVHEQIALLDIHLPRIGAPSSSRATNVSGHSDFGVRRRLRHLPLLGRLLARAGAGAHFFSTLSRGCGRFPGHSRGGVSALHPTDRNRRRGVFGRRSGLPRSSPRAPGRAAWWWCYTRVPGFAPIAEGMYAWFARHRGVLNRLSKLLWGPALQEERYAQVSWIFLRSFGLIYAAAFASRGVQVLGLIGHAGILPLRGVPARRRTQHSAARRTDCCPRCSGRIPAIPRCSQAPSPVCCWDCSLPWAGALDPRSSACSCFICPMSMRDRPS